MLIIDDEMPSIRHAGHCAADIRCFARCLHCFLAASSCTGAGRERAIGRLLAHVPLQRWVIFPHAPGQGMKRRGRRRRAQVRHRISCHGRRPRRSFGRARAFPATKTERRRLRDTDAWASRHDMTQNAGEGRSIRFLERVFQGDRGRRPGELLHFRDGA